MSKSLHVGKRARRKMEWNSHGAKVKREKKNVGHVRNGERALSLGILSPFPTFSISKEFKMAYCYGPQS